jgi:YndJ-like protein
VKGSAIIGGAIWAALARWNRVDLAWIDLLFLFAPLVIVPLGLELSAQCANQGASELDRIVRAVQFPAALLVVASFFVARGIVAAALAAGWAAFCAVLAMSSLVNLARGAHQRLSDACFAVAFFYPIVGSAWLIASRYGLTPLGFQEPIVLLTAVHFHYAGFAAPILASATARALERRLSGVWMAMFRGVVAAALAGPAILAVGFVVGARLKLAAALILAAAEIGLAVFFIPVLVRAESWASRIFLGVAAGSVIFSMVMAALWAIGEYPLQPFVHLESMARLHGTANAFGFTLCGLLGFISAGGATARERSAGT